MLQLVNEPHSCPDCAAGEVRDVTGRAEMLPELVRWCAGEREPPRSHLREELLVRAASVVAANATNSQEGAWILRQHLLEAIDDPGAHDLPRLRKACPRDDHEGAALRLVTKLEVASTLAEVQNLANELAERAAQENALVLTAWASALLRAGDALWSAAKRADECPLFAGDRTLAAELLGFGALAQNPLDAAADRDFVLDAIVGEARILELLSRVATDAIALMEDGSSAYVRSDAGSAPKDALVLVRERAIEASAAVPEALRIVRETPPTKAPLLELPSEARGALRAMRVALFHVVLDPTRIVVGEAHADEAIAAVRSGAYDVSYRVGSVQPLAELRRAIEASPLEPPPPRSAR